MQQFFQKIQTINHQCQASYSIYAYLISLGRLQNKNFDKLKPYVLMTGCQAQVWLHLDLSTDTLLVEGYSDSLIVAGLINIIAQVYQTEKITTLMQLDIRWYEQLVIYHQLSLRRMVGFQSTLNFIHKQVFVSAGLALTHHID